MIPAGAGALTGQGNVLDYYVPRLKISYDRFRRGTGPRLSSPWVVVQPEDLGSASQLMALFASSRDATAPKGTICAKLSVRPLLQKV